MYFLHESRDEFGRHSRSPGGERAPDGPLVLEERQEARRELDGRRRQLADEVVACAQINSESGGASMACKSWAAVPRHLIYAQVVAALAQHDALIT